MRYVIVFTDRTSKHVSEEHAAIFRRALHERVPVDYKGALYSWTTIAKILPMHLHEQEQRAEASSSGLHRCKYGRVHTNRSDCACRDAGFEKVLSGDEERVLLEGGHAPAAPSVEEQNAKTLGFTEAKLLYEARETWKKAGG